MVHLSFREPLTLGIGMEARTSAPNLRVTRGQLWNIWHVVADAAFFHKTELHDPLMPEVPVVDEVLARLEARARFGARKGAVRTARIDRLSFDEAIVLVALRDVLLDGAACSEQSHNAHLLGLNLTEILEFLFFADIRDEELASYHAHVEKRNADLEAAMQAAIAEGRLR